MIPNAKWFPSSIQARAAWFDNFSKQFEPTATSLGFAAADITAVQNDNAVFQFLASTATAVDAYADAVRQYRIFLSEGNIGEPTPAFPANPMFTPPLPAVATGIFERLDDLVKRIRVAPAYTPEIGALLGIIPSATEPTPENAMQPKLKATAMPGSVVEVAFKRGGTDGVELEIRVDKGAAWTSAGRFFRSPAALNIPDGTGLPHAVEIRARFVEGNSPVGQNSDTINVVTLP